jgi:hypothetical protein
MLHTYRGLVCIYIYTGSLKTKIAYPIFNQTQIGHISSMLIIVFSMYLMKSNKLRSVFTAFAVSFMEVAKKPSSTALQRSESQELWLMNPL